VRDVYRRAETFWASALPKHQGQTLLVVSHGSTIQALVNTALAIPMTRHHLFQQTHSGLTVVDFQAPVSGAGQLHLLNLTTPIGEQLPKLKAGKQRLRLLLLPCQPRLEVEDSLAKLARAQPIHACLVEDLPHCHLAMQTFLGHHPETVTLAVRRSGFLHQWHQTIEPSLHKTTQANLTTIAAVCGESQVQTFLHRVVGQPLQAWPNALTVLHYPIQARRPILQTFNARPVP
jgi:probable phosphoglycerate mutase